MWLINTSSLTLQYFHQAEDVRYAILSHTWEDDEMTFQDMQNLHAKQELRSKEGFQKMEACCKQALSDRLSYAWVDTCCIDKSSSSELSEAINSMFSWYENATFCYAYLADVSSYSPMKWLQVHESRWFSRGWTLQELLAPAVVLFFSREWILIGTKLQMCQKLSSITGIDETALQGRPLMGFSVAERMSWAASRKTTRIEDIAYCLLGIFDIHMPLLYGEGTRAFRRLQEQILEMTEDYSIFVWQGTRDIDVTKRTALLAYSPANFRPGNIGVRGWEFSKISNGPLRHVSTQSPASWDSNIHEIPIVPPTVTSRGIRINLPLLHQSGEQFTAILAEWGNECQSERKWVCLDLERDPGAPTMSRHRTSLRVTALPDIEKASVVEIYGRRDDEDRAKRLSENWQTNFLARICDETLTDAPLKDAVELCRRLGRETAWCHECVAYSPVCPNATFCARCNRRQLVDRIEEIEAECQAAPYEQTPFIYEWAELQREIVGLVECLQAVDTFEVNTGDDIRLAKMEASLKPRFQKLPRLLMHLLMCCLVTITQERPSLSVHLSSHTKMEESTFLSDLLLALDGCQGLGHVGLRLCAEQRALLSGERNDVLRATLVIQALRCCQSLARNDESALKLVDLALSWYGLSFTQHFNLFKSWALFPQSMSSTITTFRYPETTLLKWQRACGAVPSVCETAHFVPWLWRLYDFYTGGMTALDVTLLCKALHALHKHTGKEGTDHFTDAHTIGSGEVANLFQDIMVRDTTFSMFKANIRGCWRGSHYWEANFAQIRQD